MSGLRVPDAVVRMHSTVNADAGRAWLSALPTIVDVLERAEPGTTRFAHPNRDEAIGHAVVLTRRVIGT